MEATTYFISGSVRDVARRKLLEIAMIMSKLDGIIIELRSSSRSTESMSSDTVRNGVVVEIE